MIGNVSKRLHSKQYLRKYTENSYLWYWYVFEENIIIDEWMLAFDSVPVPKWY